MANKAFRADLVSRISACLTDACAAGELSHNPTLGRRREASLASLVKATLPGDLDVGNGIIVDAADGQSPQTDIIVYCPSLLPPLLWGKTDEGMYPIDGCIFAIEVKSTLSAQKLQEAIDSAGALRRLKMKEQHRTELGLYYPPPATVLFAYATDLKGSDIHAELYRYAERDDAAFVNPAISMICVAGRGFWNFQHSWKKSSDLLGTPLPQESVWHGRSASSEHDEVIDFLGVLSNSTREFVEMRAGRFRPENPSHHPMIGPYIIHSRDFDLCFKNGRREPFFSTTLK